ncbi:MAG: hypothetical protein QXO86_06975 [Nitrososphaerota archaeon]
MARYRAPDIPAEKVTPEIVRDELLKCFESANREFMEILGQPYQDAELKKQVRQFLEGVFRQCGVSIENPTKEGLLMAIESCKSNAEKMMGEKGSAIIKHHYEEMIKLVNKLP